MLVLLTAYNMDTGLLNLNEEHFPTCYVYEEVSTSLDGNNKPYYNEWEDERELNGDIGLIPEPSSFCESLKDITDIANSPPSELFLKMLDWSNLICADGLDGLVNYSSISHQLPHTEETDLIDKTNSSFDEKDFNNFDITTYINEPDSKDNSRKVKPAVKKIDLEAQKYIVDNETDKNESLDTSDDVIDVETVFEGKSLPVLEANDAFSLLEQFEASEKPNLPNTKYNNSNTNNTNYGYSENLLNTIEMNVNNILNSPVEIFEKIPQEPIDIFEGESNDKVEVKIEPNTVIKKEEKVVPKQSESNNYVKNKQIRDALPQELIARINESGKRRTITVIPPIPTKKRGSSRSLDSLPRIKLPKLINNEQFHFDHDYCAYSLYPKEPHKDSGFQSSEEDDRSIIRNQPTVKTADGKLMVSLLKVNTIRNNQKKKLNLEEYKKRRFINSNPTSQGSSPISSTCSSPLPEDENLKRIKHQEKLLKMATELLNTPPKSAQRVEPAHAKPIFEAVPKSVELAKIVPPPDLEVKTYVSIGTNTQLSSKKLLTSTQELEEIKPLLQKVSDKINSNSFITSLIENIPKVNNVAAESLVESTSEETVREDKIIHYLKKDRLPVKTQNVAIQTDFDVDDDKQARYRRRIETRSPSTSPCRSCTSTSSYRRRRNSSDSSQRSRSSRRSNSSSSHSSRVSSRSPSRSISPKRSHCNKYSDERLKEVEERRVIYVGRIANGTFKDDLRRRFQHFGPITNISLHFRDYGDNYGFVTFANKEDAYEAVEHGNDGHVYPKYDLSFGGRRIFCKTSYSDLDNVREDVYNYYPVRSGNESSFDALLRAAQEKIRKRKP